ncbi:MAG: hypothetical protein ABIH42_03050, partial [Planctomycetota bacterium]
LDVFEENGYFALCKKETLLVGIGKSAGLDLIDVKEIPESLKQAIPYESYKYIAHPYSLTFSVLRQEFEKVLDTIVNHMHVEAEISKEYVATSKMICSVLSKTRQFLVFIMPPNSNIFKLYVNQKEAKRSVGKTAQHVVINLSDVSTGETEFVVEIVYQTRISEDKEMGSSGSLETIIPAVEESVPISRLTACLYLPKEFKYTDFGGNMRRLKPEGENESLWFWGKTTLYPSTREQNTDSIILSSIDAIKRLFATGGDMITVKLTGEGTKYTFVKQGAGGNILVSYYSKNFFFALDFIILLVVIAGLLLIARFIRITKTALAILSAIFFFILSTIAEGATREFLETAFFGSLVAAFIWLIVYLVAFVRQSRYGVATCPYVAESSPPEEDAAEENEKASKDSDDESDEKKGGVSNE